MSGCESWTVKKAECRRIDAFELWCWMGQEDPLEEGMATHSRGVGFSHRGAWWAVGHRVAKSCLSSFLAWRIPGAGKSGGLPSMGSHRVGHE